MILCERLDRRIRDVNLPGHGRDLFINSTGITGPNFVQNLNGNLGFEIVLTKRRQLYIIQVLDSAINDHRISMGRIFNAI